ncbi:MAG TPA: energy-coupling factor transporter transmembrane component T [Anaerolineales bacterium]|nr:energy-coupling factor transporter transmembrane component T [Anaerolineales bacterium]
MPIEYQKGESTLHSLDARTKLLLFVGLTMIAVVVIDPIFIAALFAVLYLFGAMAVERQMLNRNLRVLIVIFLTFSLFQILFFTPKDAVFLFYLIPGVNWIPVTIQSLVRGVAVFFRFFIVVLSVHLMLYTTPPVDLVLGLTRRERERPVLPALGASGLLGLVLFAIAFLSFNDQIQRLPLAPSLRLAVVGAGVFVLGYVLYSLATHGLPPEMGMALSIGFATVGILSQQSQKITDAQKARGYDVQPKNLIRRVQVLTALLIPIFLATLERSQDIAIAILARAFDYNIGARTYRRQLKFRSRDYVVMAIIVAVLLGSMALVRFGLGNPTEQFILGMIGR